MPVILPAESFNAWTDPALTSASATVELLNNIVTELQFHPVRTLVNYARADRAELIEPFSLS